MKVVFLFDNNEYVEVEPGALQLRQMAPGQSALGLIVNVPVRGEDGNPVTVEGVTQTQQAFRSLINYSVDLSVPKPAETPAPPVAVSVPVVEEAKPQLVKKAKKKGK
jgi:hypothetical protein